MKKRLFFDMDNVLVDFQSGIDRLEPAVREAYKDKLDEVPGIFSLMDPADGALNAVRELAQHYDVYILSTAPWLNPSAWSDKLKWVQQYLGDIFYKRLILTHRKDLCTGDFLIDDRPNNGTKDFSGEWIPFGSERFPDWDSVLNYLLPEQ